MEVERTVSIEEPMQFNESEVTDDALEQKYDLPVTRAHTIASEILHRIYSDNDERNQEDRHELVNCVRQFSAQSDFSGSANDYHNFSVDLARNDEYGLACDVLEIGLDKKKGGFCRNCDLLADYLQYGVSCGRTREAKKHFKDLLEIPRRRWTWRGFSFSVRFLQQLEERGELDNSIKQLISKIDCTHVDYGRLKELEPFEKVMLALAQEFKAYKPKREDPYEIEAQIYEYLGDESKRLELLKQAQDSTQSCPKCALTLADMLYEMGDYGNACESIHRALVDSRQTQSSVNKGYLHYLYALCEISKRSKNNEKLSEEIVIEIYEHFNKALREFDDDDKTHRDIILSNVCDIRDDTGIDVPDKYISLSSLVEE